MRHLTAIVASFALGGCACAPVGELAQAHAVVTSATAGRGVADLARAESKLTLGQRLTNAHAYGPARWILEQAQVDAELALARSAAEDAIRNAAVSVPGHATARPPASPL